MIESKLTFFEKKTPQHVVEICRILSEAGYQSWAVGGSIRDMLMGKEPSDWDIATDALPEEVMRLYEKVIPTGIEHGTVSVLVPVDRGMEAIEITTFRGEGNYSNHRHPDEVKFGVPLAEDLARRDFKCNAIAYDPIAKAIFDPFDGQRDIKKKLLSAVGNPLKRFDEDGLRVMRAIRFQAVLGFSLEKATLDALQPSLDSFESVAKERVLAELGKLYGGKSSKEAILTSMKVGIFSSIFPWVSSDKYEAILYRMNKLPKRLNIQLLSVCWENDWEDIEKKLQEMTVSNRIKKYLGKALSDGKKIPVSKELYEGRLYLSKLDVETIPDLLCIWEIENTRVSADNSWVGGCRSILLNRDPIKRSELKVRGADLINKLGLPPGPKVGELLKALHDAVLRDPKMNNTKKLMEMAKSL